MIKSQLLSIAILLAATVVAATVVRAQAPLPSTIIIEVENYVEYAEDTSDPLKRGTNPNLTTVNPLPNTFIDSDHFGDIVTVNGQPAKGLAYCSARVIGNTTSTIVGRPIADVTTSTYRSYYFQILNESGAAIGTLYTSGPHGQAPPPGSPGNYVILGGTGPFVGARGQAGLTQVAAGRLASASEDPSRRRIHSGGKRRFILSVYAMTYPQVLSANGQPAVTHADFKQVTAATPATAGEILSVFASGLGPTRPGVEPGETFPMSPLSTVNSPVHVTVGGKAAEVISAVGFPGAVDGYQVNFKLPDGLTRGSTQVRVSSAWIWGVPVTIAVQ